MGDDAFRRLKEDVMTRRFESVSALVSLSGAFVWATIPVLAAARRAPFGIMELLFLFAVLVVVPLGMELARILNPISMGRMGQVFGLLQPPAGIAAVVSLWGPPGPIAASLMIPWFLFATVVALVGLASLRDPRNRSLVTIAVAFASVDLTFGTAWAVISRAGGRPMGFQEPIVLLTAIHYHYSGFATAVIAAAALHLLDRRGMRIAIVRAVVWLVLILPFVLAMGFVVSPLLRMVAAVGLAVCVTSLAGIILWSGACMQNRTARVFVRTGSAAVWVGMGLAALYAVSNHAGLAFLTMPGMASTHGVLNGLGFVLLSTLAFLIEFRAAEIEEEESSNCMLPQSTVPRKRPMRVTLPVPEFIAREFYDR
jgi:YndJ-like protein